uniref:RING-type domain-containing protein n=2 Tax=Panagrolaimus sp. JU765 TaxID=591449 RepID=A0AC34Q909_9BILA
MSWNRQMAFDPSIGGQPKLIEQLCLAKEMGFSENEIIAALEMNNTNSKSKCYNPFNDTSEMIDKLTLVQKHKNAPETTDHPPRYLNDSNDQRLRYIDRYRRSDDSDSSSSSCTSNNHGNCAENNNTSLKFPPHWTSTTLTPRTTSVNRSASFTNALGYTSGYSSALRRPKSYLSTLSTSTTDRDSLERKLTELCSEHEELKIMIERKDEIIDEQHHKLEEMNDINERYEIIQEKLNKTDDDLKKCRCENAAMEREILRLKNPEKTIKEMENEIIQLRQENREYREKQSTLVCTTCMDHPRNVLYMPCLHFICCSNCAYNSDTCSICRTRIMGKVEVYQ